MQKYLFSIIICTHNRSHTLGDTLRSLDKLEKSPGIDYEIIVVDNASTDATKQVTEEFIDSCEAKTRYLREDQLGKSFALNTGIAVAKGNILAFTDDDTLVEKDWLIQLARIYDEYPADCVAGKVDAIYSQPLPDWLPEELEYLVGTTILGDEVREIGYPLLPIGANLSFTREIVDKVGPFDTSIGIRGWSTSWFQIHGEENDYCTRIERVGGRMFYTPHALVHHIILPNKLEKPFYRRRAFREGRTNAILTLKNRTWKATVDESIGLIKSHPFLFFTFLLHKLLRHQKTAFLEGFHLRYYAGYFGQVLVMMPGIVFSGQFWKDIWRAISKRLRVGS